MKRLLTLLLAAAMLFSCALAEASSLGLTAEVKPATEFTAQANAAVYDELYGEYVALHDCFGRGGSDVMKRLKRLRDRQSR